MQLAVAAGVLAVATHPRTVSTGPSLPAQERETIGFLAAITQSHACMLRERLASNSAMSDV